MSLLDNMPINWFDVLILVVIGLGFRSGRKHGISVGLIPVLKWLVIAVGCAFLYEPLGVMISQASVFSLLSAFLMAYIGLGILITAIFALLKKALGGKLLGSDVFGQSEFYLGMLGGMVQFSCMLIAAVALLNARGYNSVEIANDIKYQNELYGSNFFPSLYEVQAQVFDKSLSGPFLKNQLGFLLIKPTPPEQKQLQQKEFAIP
jgi:hypothetical protein